MGSSISYGSGTPAPDDGVDVGLQSGGWDSLKSVPTTEAGARTIGSGADYGGSQAPKDPGSTGSYSINPGTKNIA